MKSIQDYYGKFLSVDESVDLVTDIMKLKSTKMLHCKLSLNQSLWHFLNESSKLSIVA